MADAGLDHLAPWLEGYLQRLAPARRPFLRRLAKALRDANARRIRDNVEPDGTPMPRARASATGAAACAAARPHVPQGRPRPQPARPDQPEPSPSASALIEPTARIHHFGGSPRRSPSPTQSAPISRPAAPRPERGDIAMIEEDTLGLLG
jgi:hypothetical protein